MIAPVIYTVCIIFSLLLAATVGYLLVRKWRGERSQPEREELEMKDKSASPLLSQHSVTGNKKLAAIIYYSEYLKEKEGKEKVKLPDVEAEANQFRDLLVEDFNYQILLEDPNPDISCEPNTEHLGNQAHLVETFKIYLQRWLEDQRMSDGIGTVVVDSFLIYFHGHGSQVMKNSCLLTTKWTAIPFDELVNVVLCENIHVNRFYLVLDCCSNSDYSPDTKAKERVRVEVEKKRVKNFGDRVVTVSAAPPGHEATALADKTLTAALVSVLRERGEAEGIPMQELEKRIRKKQNNQRSKNLPTVQHPNALKRKLFPL